MTDTNTDEQTELTQSDLHEQARQELYAYVWSAMDACNSSGLIHSFPDIIDKLRALEPAADMNRHPIVICMIDKLAQLAGISATGQTKASHIMDAYHVVATVVRGRRIRCKYCGAKLKRDPFGWRCPTKNCQWEHGVPRSENGGSDCEVNHAVATVVRDPGGR